MAGLEITHAVEREDLAVGVVRASNVTVSEAAESLSAALDELLAALSKTGISAETDARRKASRDVLRNGRYKPTGRGKPANEYLLRAIESEFPRINGPVDANNIVSLKWMVPISVWDLELAGHQSHEIRLGRADESYVFNPSGQSLELEDLVCGAAGEPSHPIVTPIKDGMATKIHAGTKELAAAIYYPLSFGGQSELETITSELASWLGSCGEKVDVASDVLLFGKSVKL
jgi:DNA/RNA-binding domain of Phe-tRNA-synthetase-like protein